MKAEGAVDKRTVLVAVRIDRWGRELLHWALVKIAEPGHNVIALHISKESNSKDHCLSGIGLGDHGALCHAKQVELSGRVISARSVREALVREAEKHATVAVIVGISKQNALRNRASSMVRYCASRLPPSVEVMAVHLGKVMKLRGTMGDRSVEGLELEHTRVPSRSFSSSEDLMEETPGWPLQKYFSVNPQALEARKLSVVQWVMNLPNRSPPETPPKAGFHSSNTTGSLFNGSEELQKELELLQRHKSSTCQWFSYDVLRKCTSDFSTGNLIGKGGCNRVYKGILPDGKPVAVKVLKSSSKEAMVDFVLEMNIVSSLKHKNILPLLGICVENDLISVYDYLREGSLEDALSGNGKGLRSVLPWEVRFKIAVEMAEALDYLHNGSSRPVIHRDIKSSNILLSDELLPQLTDFGLAIWGPKTPFLLDKGPVFGTFGYLAPEYFMYGKVSDKIDVYSFGVVLLELLSGRKSVCFGNLKGQESLVILANSMLEGGDLRSLLDPNLDGRVDASQVRKMALAAGRCIARTDRLRPPISHILKLLRGEQGIEHGCMRDYEDENPAMESDDEVYPEESCVESHLSLALLDVDEVYAPSAGSERICERLLER